MHPAFILVLFIAALGGCGGDQSMLAPAGPGAEAVDRLWWVMLWGAVAILALVMLLALYAVYVRPGRRRPLDADRFIAFGGLALPGVLLTALLIYGFRLEPQAEAGARPLVIEVTGHQWWWEVRYPGAPEAVTANEIHIPVGRTVRVEVRSADVIHSFWVPRLAGKRDLIPGHENALQIRADAPGAYRGQCAEFCGAQHARMALWVVAEPEAQFNTWLARQGRAAAEPASAQARRGRERFLSERCVECHTVRGTPAEGDKGPDLTHVGSRRTLAAGTLTANRAGFADLIAHNQRIKPGNRMESFEHLDETVVRDIAAYLEGLK
jgi:cytochrome c oxidase subunit 2